MMHTVYILGAQDPEMEAIRRLLMGAGKTVVQATAGGKPVHPGNAYEADLPLPEPGTEYVLVECGASRGHPLAQANGTYPVYACPQGGYAYSYCPEGGEYAGDYKITRVDHHRPGDPGYGRPPDEFMTASSIGQILLRLHGEGSRYLPYAGDGFWRVETPATPPEEGGTGEPSIWTVDPSIVLTAAADHCLEAAYHSRCPGVDPEALMAWRAESRAAFQKRSVEDVMRDLEAARQVLRRAIEDAFVSSICRRCGRRRDEHFPVGTCPPDENGLGVFLEPVADLRDRLVPELPEAAAREGLPYVSTVTEPGGRRKVVLGAATPDLVRLFLAGELVPGLTGHYGDPARGFAGGYLPPK